MRISGGRVRCAAFTLIELLAVVVVLAWAVMTLLFGFYLADVADYGSVFGNLATVFILIEYLFLSWTVFVEDDVVLDGSVVAAGKRSAMPP